MVRLSAKFQRAATKSKGEQKSREQQQQPNEIKHDVNKQNSIYWN